MNHTTPKALAALLCLAVSACGGGGVPLPDKFKDDTYLKVVLKGSSKSDLWWPDCDKDLVLHHYDGGGWKEAARVPGEPCLSDFTTDRGLVSGGPGVVWLAGYRFWRITADGKVEDKTDALGFTPQFLTTDGTDRYTIRFGGAAPEVVVIGDDGKAKRTLPGPAYASLAAYGQSDLFSDAEALGQTAHFDGQAWTTSSGPRVHGLGWGFAANDRWALDGGGLWRWNGTAWAAAKGPTPDLKDAGGFTPIVVRADKDKRPVLIGQFSKSESEGGFAAKYVAYRMQGDGWGAAEVFAPWEQAACAGMGCGQMVYGLLLDGGVAVSRHEFGGDTTIAVFQP